MKSAMDNIKNKPLYPSSNHADVVSIDISLWSLPAVNTTGRFGFAALLIHFEPISRKTTVFPAGVRTVFWYIPPCSVNSVIWASSAVFVIIPKPLDQYSPMSSLIKVESDILKIMAVPPLSLLNPRPLQYTVSPLSLLMQKGSVHLIASLCKRIVCNLFINREVIY